MQKMFADDGPVGADQQGVRGAGQNGMNGTVTAEIIARSKVGDGLSMAAFIMGLLGIIFGSFAGFGYSAIRFALVSGLPMAVAAIVCGALGARMQRIVNKTFGMGVAGAVLGLVAVIVIIMGVLMNGWYEPGYYYCLGA
ncbi:MAG: hypothetical protein V1934_08605 [Methanobacteriota archaeon]